MTIQVTIKNEEQLDSGAALEVVVQDTSDALAELVLLLPGQQTTLYVHKDRSILISEIDNPGRNIEL